MSGAGAATDLYTCPKCGERATKQLVSAASYHCPRCTFELAHVELSPSGKVRSVLGWLRSAGEVLHERYQVTGVLGKGGFAATYLAEDLRLKGRRRAIKEVPKSLFDEHETELLSRLQHPAIPDISDRFEADEMVYLVLEFGGTRSLEGERKASGGRIPVEKLVPWMRQLCDALSYLHAQDPPVIHRDLKPENILLEEHDRIMLIDFGIAKESAEWAVTRTIARAASHGFSPPEQVLGTGTDQRSDVYALGATMYALLTGTVPTPAHERVAGHELPPPRTHNPAIPAELDEIIVRCLDLNVNRRPQSIQELSRVFEPGGPPAGDAETFARTVRLGAGPPAALASEPTPAAVASKRAALPLLAWVGAGVAVIALAVGAYVVLRGSERPTTATGTAAVPASPSEEPARAAAAPARPPDLPAPATPSPAVTSSAPTLPGSRRGAALEAFTKARKDARPEATAIVTPSPSPPPRRPVARKPTPANPPPGAWEIVPRGATKTE
jgi:serine/threonine-protein kinase